MMAVLDYLVGFVEELAEGVQAACSGWWMFRDFSKTYALTEADIAACAFPVGKCNCGNGIGCVNVPVDKWYRAGR